MIGRQGSGVPPAKVVAADVQADQHRAAGRWRRRAGSADQRRTASIRRDSARASPGSSARPRLVVARHHREVQRQQRGMGVGHDVRHPGPAEHVDIIGHVPEGGNSARVDAQPGTAPRASMVALFTPAALISTRP